MRARWTLWTVVVALSVSVLVFGTGGFDVATTDRPAAIAVADHDRALVSVWDPGANREPPRHAGEEPVTSNDTAVKLLVVENRADGQTLDLRVTERPDSPVTVDGSGDDIRGGEIVPVHAVVDCGGHRGPTSARLTIEVTSGNGGLRSVIQFDATVHCGGP